MAFPRVVAERHGSDPQIGDLTELTIAQITERIRNQAQVMRQRMLEPAS
jgi:hypothetical protein